MLHPATLRIMSCKSLVYCASPARMGDQKKQILDYVVAQGKAPLHPFNALPHEYFEGGKVSRQDTLEICCRLIDVCDEFWLFGISEGTLIEYRYVLSTTHANTKPVKLLFRQFDPEWQQRLEEFRDQFADVIARLEELT